MATISALSLGDRNFLRRKTLELHRSGIDRIALLYECSARQNSFPFFWYRQLLTL